MAFRDLRDLLADDTEAVLVSAILEIPERDVDPARYAARADAANELLEIAVVSAHGTRCPFRVILGRGRSLPTLLWSGVGLGAGVENVESFHAREETALFARTIGRVLEAEIREERFETSRGVKRAVYVVRGTPWRGVEESCERQDTARHPPKARKHVMVCRPWLRSG